MTTMSDWYEFKADILVVVDGQCAVFIWEVGYGTVQLSPRLWWYYHIQVYSCLCRCSQAHTGTAAVMIEAEPNLRGWRVVQRLKKVRCRWVSPLKKPVVRHHLYKSMKHGYYLPGLSVRVLVMVFIALEVWSHKRARDWYKMELHMCSSPEAVEWTSFDQIEVVID